MRELFGKLIGMDPAASDALRVIEYFDRLVRARSGATSLLKEAAVLSRSTIGYLRHGQSRLFLPTGGEAPPAAMPEHAIVADVSSDSRVWLVVDKATVETAPIVLERLAIALALSEKQTAEDGGARSAVAILLSPPLPDEEPGQRTAALGRLRLEANGAFRALALPLSVTPPAGWPQTLIDTPWGPVRGVIARAGATWNQPGGIGTVAPGLKLHDSWRRAIIALRICAEGQRMEAESLGSILLVLESTESDEVRKSDIGRVERTLEHLWTLPELKAVAEGRSLRAIAGLSGLHHSTITLRLTRLPQLLGFDPQTGIGRARLTIALLLYLIDQPAAHDRPNI